MKIYGDTKDLQISVNVLKKIKEKGHEYHELKIILDSTSFRLHCKDCNETIIIHSAIQRDIFRR